MTLPQGLLLRTWIGRAAVIVGCLSSMLLAGCGIASTANGRGGNAPAPVAWQLLWASAPNPDTSGGRETPQQAFAAQARVRTDTGALQMPVAATWLMQGPNMALALVQLDTSGQRMGLAALVAAPDSRSWMLDGAVTAVRPDVQGSPTDPHMAKLLPLPATVYQIGRYQHRSAPPYAMQLWLSPLQTKQAFVLARLTGHGASPTPGSTPVTIQGRSGWQQISNDVTSVVVPLSDGEVVVFAGLSASAQVTDLAGAAVQHLDSLLQV